jgi:hypothetical protein
MVLIGYSYDSSAYILAYLGLRSLGVIRGMEGISCHRDNTEIKKVQSTNGTQKNMVIACEKSTSALADSKF